MNADLQETTDTDQGPIEVRTDARLSAGVGAVAAIVAVAYLARALGGGGVLDWALVVVTGAIAAAFLQSFADARVPLLVVDEQGVRLRHRRTWHGLPWTDIAYVEHQPRQGLFRDGRVVLVPRDGEAAEQSVLLSLSTRVTGAGDDLTAALEALAGNPDQVVEVVSEQELDEWDEIIEAEVGDTEYEDFEDDTELHDDEDERPLLHDPRPTLARGIGFIATRLRLTLSTGTGTGTEEPTAAPEPTVALPMVASATPIPLRDPVGGSRSEIRFAGAAALKADPYDTEDTTSLQLPEAGELRRDGSPDLVIDALLIEQGAVEPAADPVVGPELAAARTRLSLTVDQLAERTRIRPHVIESIEVDDFAPCGGDFYARGHLRTLARVLGVDAAPLLTSYDERYADAPIDARRVFEAELATGVDGPIRSTRGGPNWSVLVAAVMALVLAWSIARLIMDSPVDLHSKPILNGSGGANSQVKLGPEVPVKLVAAAGGAHVVVRDGAGQVVFNGDLAFGEAKVVKASPPVRVQSSDGALELTVDGESRGPLGADGQPAQNTFAASS